MGCDSCCRATFPQFVSERLAPVVREFVATSGRSVNEIDHYVLHPGGPKVMATYCSTFGLPDEAVSIARESMREYGNLSSAAVLFMLNDLVASGKPTARRHRPDACARTGIRLRNAGARVVNDVAIVGAGPAGSALAIELGRRGLRVTLYEQSRGPCFKACGEGLLPHGVAALDDIAGTARRAARARPAFRRRRRVGRGRFSGRLRADRPTRSVRRVASRQGWRRPRTSISAWAHPTVPMASGSSSAPTASDRCFIDGCPRVRPRHVASVSPRTSAGCRASAIAWRCSFMPTVSCTWRRRVGEKRSCPPCFTSRPSAATASRICSTRFRSFAHARHTSNRRRPCSRARRSASA